MSSTETVRQNWRINVGHHTPDTLGRELQQRIEQLDRETDHKFALEYVSGGDPCDYKGRNQQPIADNYRWLACYPVTGGNEGWYLHVMAIYQKDDTRSPLWPTGKPLAENRYVDLATIKIFGGWPAAAELAGRIGVWLDA